MLITLITKLSIKIVKSIFFVIRISIVKLLKILDIVINIIEEFK